MARARLKIRLPPLIGDAVRKPQRDLSGRGLGTTGQSVIIPLALIFLLFPDTFARLKRSFQTGQQNQGLNNERRLSDRRHHTGHLCILAFPERVAIPVLPQILLWSTSALPELGTAGGARLRALSHEGSTRTAARLRRALPLLTAADGTLLG